MSEKNRQASRFIVEKIVTASRRLPERYNKVLKGNENQKIKNQ